MISVLDIRWIHALMSERNMSVGGRRVLIINFQFLACLFSLNSINSVIPVYEQSH